MTTAFIIGTLAGMFLIVFIFLLCAFYSEWVYDTGSHFACFAFISAVITLFAAGALGCGYLTSQYIDAPTSPVEVTEMIVEHGYYANGHVVLMHGIHSIDLKADPSWERKEFERGAKYVITHRDGILLSCYPK